MVEMGGGTEADGGGELMVAAKVDRLDSGVIAGMTWANCWFLRRTFGQSVKFGIRTLLAMGRAIIGNGHERC